LGEVETILKYLNRTKYFKLKLSIDNLGMLKWFVDRSHNVHWDCKGHRGAMCTLGKGARSSYSRKMKVNTQNLTKMELIAAGMFMTEMLWTQHFIQEQGYSAECIGLY
jgi:hypothetical protein